MLDPGVRVGARHAEGEARRQLDEFAVERLDSIVDAQEELALHLTREVRSPQVSLSPQPRKVLEK